MLARSGTLPTSGDYAYASTSAKGRASSRVCATVRGNRGRARGDAPSIVMSELYFWFMGTVTVVEHVAVLPAGSDAWYVSV
jgi:hypothetical protein